ncbi:hypothetical protein KUTeg_009477 [Tegillarca granosa]|uniref:ubiquitinyl hydrolase 1 n=1 Tax=Tegillarca granosa TaxID=220873 RepID=A0ABQ9F432_TEGGR|nr:hypothetical protein KUTeg_009477 [Tegillarca granosa]
MFSRNIAWIGGVSAVVATGIYILFGPSERKRSKKKDICPGLDNLGNTCFLNAVLQAWSSCPSVIDWLSKFLSSREDSGCKEYLAYPIVNSLKVLNNDGDVDEDIHSPVELIKELRARRWVISADEQDAHEFFHVLTETLDEETSRYRGLVSLFDVESIQSKQLQYQTEKHAITRSRGLLPVLPHNVVDHPFRGLLASQLECIECGHRNPVKYDVFDSLSLSIPDSFWVSKNLESLLQHYISAETVQNVECLGCSKVSQSSKKRPLPRRTFKKKLTIGKLPHCLCIHIQRKQWMPDGMPIKRHEHIKFPEILNLDNYVYNKVGHDHRKKGNLTGGRENITFRNPSSSGSVNSMSSAPVNLLRALNYDFKITQNGLGLQPQNSLLVPNMYSDINHNSPSDVKVSKPEFMYKLSAAIVHLGDALSGHFVTYRRSPMSVKGELQQDRWLYCSDTTISKVTLEDVLSTDAYMLFYERI